MNFENDQENPLTGRHFSFINLALLRQCFAAKMVLFDSN